jgi:hemerythrin-like domain-containing protein
MAIRIGQRPDHGFDEPLGLLTDCHRRIEYFLAVFAAIADRAKGGPLTEAERVDLNMALAYLTAAASRHTADEEESLFPLLRASSHPDATRVLELVSRLEHEHRLADEHHRVVDILARRWLQLGGLGTGDIRDFDAHLAALRDLYESHIRMEDSEVFPVAGRLLSPPSSARCARWPHGARIRAADSYTAPMSGGA